jgi:GrpB-like predicted nucleotidyltransferase (UPF0157 family)
MSPFVVPYDSRWPARFEQERLALVDAMGDRLVDDVQHIGSTAIPGLLSKPILDMIAGVADLADAARSAESLRALGYEEHPHRLDAVLFIGTDHGVDTRHLHLTVPGSELWRERLAFRDALRADPSLLEEYRALKLRLLNESSNGSYDSSGKREFVRRVLVSVGVELRDDLHVGDG